MHSYQLQKFKQSFSLDVNTISLQTATSWTRVRKSRYWEEMLLSPVHCCDVTKPPYFLSGELCSSPFHSNRLYVYTVCSRRGDQCFSVLRTRHTDVVGDSSERSYVTEQGHNVPLLRTRGLEDWIFFSLIFKIFKEFLDNLRYLIDNERNKVFCLIYLSLSYFQT